MSINKNKIFLIKIMAGLIYLGNFLLNKSVGLLFIVIILYNLAPWFGFGQPYSYAELMFWLDQLPESSKTTVFTSIITISGFLLAFSINSINQRQQLMSQMRIEALNDIDNFFNLVARNISTTNIYAKYLLEVVNHIKNKRDDRTIEFHITYVIKETEKHILLRALIQDQAIEVHRFKSRYSVILASSWGALSKLDNTIQAFRNITDNLWFDTPILYLGDPDIVNRFITHVDEEQCNNFINAYNDNFDVINESVGGLRGGLLASITGQNFSTLINLFKLKQMDD